MIIRRWHAISKITLASLLSLTLIVPSISQGASEPIKGANSAVSDTVKLNKITINATSYAELKQVSMIPGNEGKVVSFTYSIYNGSNSDLQFIDYWARVQSKSGAKFSVKLLTQDKEKNTVAPKTTQEFTFYTTVGDNIELDDLIFQFIKWDFSQANFERMLGQITIPAGYNNEIESGATGVVDINGVAVNIKVNNAQLSQNDYSYLVNAEVEFTNSGNRSVTTPNYAFYILTTEGIIYQLTGTTLDMNLQPKDAKKVQVSATIPNTIKSGDWKLVIAIQEATPKQDIPIVMFELPDGTDNASNEVDDKKDLDIDGVAVQAYIKSANVSGNEVTQNVSIAYNFENKGYNTVTIPDYSYTILTTEGISYPITVGTTGVKINARENKDIYLSASFPSTIKFDQLKLVVSEPTVEGKKGFPVAIHAINSSSNGVGTAGQTITFSNKHGVYNMKLNSLQRIPWEDDDIIAADLTISNNTTAALPMPDLTGLFEVDGVSMSDSETQLVKLDNLISIPAKSSSNLIVYVKIPYTYEYDQVKVNVLEKGIGEAAVSTQVASFINQTKNLVMSTVKANQNLVISDIGKRADIKVRNAFVYEGSTTDLYYAELIMENKEKRSTNLTKLEGFVRTKDDIMFPATVSANKETITPNGKVLLSLWSRIPKTYSDTKLDIIIGQGAKASALAIGEDVSDAIIRASIMEHYKSNPTTTGSLLMKVYPYEISVSRVKASIENDTKLDLSFVYSLTKDSEFITLPDQHKLVIEFVSGATKFEKEFAFDAGAGEALELGSNITKAFTHSELGLIYKVLTYSDFKLNFYDKFDGHKRLIGSSELEWNVEN